ncbi:hypothetical protein FKP32DRAFT_1582183 [Trametes sanguinea]|nr:hypothetical protein FKP32DRAFT_1582183 [Trametes sanguinea]
MVYGDIRGSATLAVLARTARCFHEVALDRLWHTQTSLVPLVKCFPDTLLKTTIGNDGVEVVDFVSEPKPEDWTRVKFYAPRIKIIRPDVSLAADPLWEGCLDEEAYVTLLKSKGSPPLLPNLHSFQWIDPSTRWGDADEVYAIASFSLMLNPQVASMDVIMHRWKDEGSAEAIASALRQFGIDSSQLRSVNLVSSSCVPIEKAVLDLACRHPRLKSLKCSWSRSMTVDAITYLSELQGLQEVAIRADRKTTVEAIKVAKARGHRFFPALQSLVLQTESLELCREWLDVIRAPNINNFTFVVDQPPTAKNFGDFLVMLVERGGLEHLRFICDTPCPRSASGYSIIPMTLEPLLQLNLVTLQLEPAMPIDIDDTFVERMARAWPRLQTLELNATWRRYPVHTPLVTIPGLLSLTVHCPNLTSLGITFDPDVSSFQDKFADGDRPAEGRSFGLDKPFNFGVGATVLRPQDNGFTLASVISDFCPGLVTLDNAWRRVEGSSLEGLDEELDDADEAWWQIHCYAKEMARVRRQERLWTA